MPNSSTSLDRYQTYMQRQIRELLTEYGDGASAGSMENGKTHARPSPATKPPG
jgi:hypothetical protein